jgi:hypothetical protein
LSDRSALERTILQVVPGESLRVHRLAVAVPQVVRFTVMRGATG